MNKYAILSLILLVGLSGSGYYLYEYYQKYTQLKLEYSSLTAKYKKALMNISELQKMIQQLNKSIQNLTIQLEEKNNKISLLEAEANRLKAEKDKYYSMLYSFINKDKLAKIRFEFINKTLSFNFSQLDAYSKCLNKENDSFNYPCFVDLLHKEGFSYKRDQGDYLDNPYQFVVNRGGDCEDWSAFTYSLIYYLRANGVKKLLLFEKSPNDKFYLYKEGNTIYYIPNATKVEINLDEYRYAAMICYEVTKTSGHCINALCKSPVLPTEFNKSDCIAFEPQNGEFLGLANRYKLMILLLGDFYFKQWQFWK